MKEGDVQPGSGGRGASEQGAAEGRASAESGPLDPARWLDEHGEALYGFAMLRLGRPDAAEEAVQEALVAALESVKRFERRSAERTWLIGILKHKVVDALRRESRGRAAPIEEALRGDSGAFQKGHWRESQSSWEVSSGESEDFRRVLQESLASLPEPMRLAICLREIDGLETSQVCEILGITPTNLWTLVHRAKLRLRRELDVRWFKGPQGGSR